MKDDLVNKVDPILQEVWQMKDEFSAQFNNDVEDMCKHLQKVQQIGGREYVSFTPNKVEPTSDKNNGEQ